jgi:hypothetical protein
MGKIAGLRYLTSPLHFRFGVASGWSSRQGPGLHALRFVDAALLEVLELGDVFAGM